MSSSEPAPGGAPAPAAGQPSTSAASVPAQQPAVAAQENQAAQDAQPHIEIDTDPSTEDDSAYGDDIQSYATSLTSSVQNYQWEHGRRYHAYREGSYQFPNDEREQDRLDLTHAMLTLSLGGALHLAPVTNPKRVLDIGTGTGIWAIDAGDLYPAAEVIGNDFSPIQPKWVPPNVHFEVDDVESDWPARAGFDFIHSRYMAGSIKDWPSLVQRVYDQTNEGGWAEFQDFDLRQYSEDGSIETGNKVIEFHELLLDACEKVGRTATPGNRLKEWVEAAGFRNVHQEIRKIPLGPWAKDKTLKQIGGLNLIQFLDGIEAFSLGTFTRVHGWTPEQVQAYLVQVRSSAKQKHVHIMFNFHIVYGQR